VTAVSVGYCVKRASLAVLFSTLKPQTQRSIELVMDFVKCFAMYPTKKRYMP